MDSLQKPLKGRENLVLSSNPSSILEGFTYAVELSEALSLMSVTSDEIMIIGGAQIYKQTIDIADCLLITHIHHAFEEMDAFFPEWNSEQWKVIYTEFHPKDERHAWDFEFKIYERIRD